MRGFAIATLVTARKSALHRREPLLSRLRDAFLGQGYEQMTMLALAPLAGVSRRTLYNHFANKEDAFRFLLRCDGDIAIEQALAAARECLAAHAAPLDIFVLLMDVRYADNRRRLAQA